MVLDYQQERLFDLGWLTAAIEGEGSLTIIKSCGQWKNAVHYVPTCRISNTKEAFIRNVERICKENKIGVHIGMRQQPGNRQPIWIARIQGMRRCKRLLELIYPRMVIKRDNAELLLELINYRLSLPHQTPYSGYELELRNKVQALNKNGGNKSKRILRDYMPNSQRDEDIVRTSGESQR